MFLSDLEFHQEIVPFENIWVYVLVDPRNKEIRYVGKTICPVTRLTAHIQRSQTYAANDWLRELASLNLIPEMHLVEEVIGTEEDGLAAEDRWIARCLQRGARLENCKLAGVYRRLGRRQCVA